MNRAVAFIRSADIWFLVGQKSKILSSLINCFGSLTSNLAETEEKLIGGQDATTENLILE